MSFPSRAVVRAIALRNVDEARGRDPFDVELTSPGLAHCLR